MMKSLSQRLLLIAALYLHLGCHIQLAAAAGTFKVGIVTSATGPLADIWDESVQGLQLWLKQFTDRYGASGMAIKGMDTTFNFNFGVAISDDQSSADSHFQQVQGLIGNGTDFIFCAQPAFATNESIQVSSAGRLSLHGTTFNTKVYQRNLPSVFGVTQPNTRFTQELFKQYKSNKISKIALACRVDVEELNAACQAVRDDIQAELLQLTVDIKYNSSSTNAIQDVAQQLNASNAEALVACSLQSDGAQLLKLFDQMRKPLKNIFLTNGPARESFLSAVGPIAQFVTTPAAWHPDESASDHVDDFYGTAKDYATKFAAVFSKDPTYVAAGTSAMGMVLLRALQSAFQKCNISATGGNPQLLLYSSNVLVCTDNQNNGMQRLISTMQSLVLSPTFYGDITFNQYRQNYGSSMLVLQAFQVIKDLKPVLSPGIVLPLSDATTAVQIPQPNRYAPVCGPGTHTPTDDFLPCVPCDEGYFQEFNGKLTCDLCAKDYYANTTGNADCAACPDNSETYQRGSTSQDACYCKVGFYSPTGTSGVACEMCPDHAVCIGGTSPPSPLPGWYAERDKPFEMFNCNPDLVCPGGFECTEGYTGRMCMYCDTGYYMAFNRCLPCPAGGTSMVEMLLMYALFIILNLSISRQLELFHVVTGFCQFLSVINIFNVNWPPMYNNIMNIANILSFETDIMQPQCYDPSWRFEQNLYIQLAMPMFVLALVLTWIAFTYICFRVKLRIQGKALSDFRSVHFSSSWETGGGSSINGNGPPSNNTSRAPSNSGSFVGAETSAWWLLLQAAVHIPNDPQEMAEVVLERLSIPLMTINIMYLVIFKYCLSAFYCYDFVGTKALYFSADDICYTPAHYRMMMAATAGLVVYIGGMWAMFYHTQTLLARTRSFGEKRPLLLFGWMYERYSAKYHWYEATQLLQKTGYVLIAIFLVDDPTLQTILALVFTILLTLIDIRTNALADSNMHILQAGCDAGLVVTLMLGLVFYNNQVTTRTTNFCEVLGLVVLFVVLALLGIALLAEIVFNALLLVLKSRHSKVAKKWGHGIKGHTHMYHVFKPWFMVKWLLHANEPDWAAWHKLCMHLQQFIHPTSETSYLSVKKVGFFWRYLLDNFPETLDYLISIEAEDQEHFAQFIEVMYQHFFDSSDEHKYQLNMVVTDRYRASVAHWLSSADPKDIAFVQRLVASAFGKAHGLEAEEHASRAISRVSKNNFAIPGFDPVPEQGTLDGLEGFNDEAAEFKFKLTAGDGDTAVEGGIAAASFSMLDVANSNSAQPAGVGSFFAPDKTSTTGLPEDFAIGTGSLRGSVPRGKGGKNFAEQFRAKGRTMSDSPGRVASDPGLETVHVLNLGRTRLSQAGTGSAIAGVTQAAMLGDSVGLNEAGSAVLPPVSDGAPVPTRAMSTGGNMSIGSRQASFNRASAAAMPQAGSSSRGLGSVSALAAPALLGSKVGQSSRFASESRASSAQLWPSLGEQLQKEIEEIDAVHQVSAAQPGTAVHQGSSVQVGASSRQEGSDSKLSLSPRPPPSPSPPSVEPQPPSSPNPVEPRPPSSPVRVTAMPSRRNRADLVQQKSSVQERLLDEVLSSKVTLSTMSEHHETVLPQGHNTTSLVGDAPLTGSTQQLGGTSQQQGSTQQLGDTNQQQGSTMVSANEEQHDRPSQLERAATAVLEEVALQQQHEVVQQTALEQAVLEDAEQLIGAAAEEATITTS